MYPKPQSTEDAHRWIKKQVKRKKKGKPSERILDKAYQLLGWAYVHMKD